MPDRVAEGRDYVRALVRQRDLYTCQDCNRVWIEGERNFDIHHLNGECGKNSRGYDRKEDIHKLITLCHKCHFNRPDHSYRKKGPMKEKKITKKRIIFMKSHLIEKRNELIWALSLQEYSLAQIGKIFNVDRSTIMRIVRTKPQDWKPKWIKQ